MNLKTKNLFKAITVALLMSVVVWSLLPLASTQNKEEGKNKTIESPGFENYDIRFDGSKEGKLKVELKRNELQSEKREVLGKRGELVKEAESKLARRIPNIEVKYNDRLGVPEIVGIQGRGRFLTAPSKNKPEKIVQNFIAANKTLYGLTEEQVNRLKVGAVYTNPDGNLTWVRLEREVNGIPVFGEELTAVLTKRGELARTAGELTTGVDDSELSFSSKLSAQDAVAMAANSIGVSVEPASLVLKNASADGNSFVFEPGPFSYEIKVEQIYFPMEMGVVELAWSVMLWQDNPAYLVLISAEDGKMLFRKNLTQDQTQSATYSFYNDDSPAPLSPITSTGNTVPNAQGATIGRTLLTVISEDPSNNLGWITDGGNTTTGNNVDAGMDLVSPDGIDAGSRPVGAPFRVFNFSYNPAPGNPSPGDSPTLANYRFGEAVNMFVWSNRYHDRLYQLGFTEAARNFQQNNFGRGGSGNDFVLAQGQDFSGTSNANFLTPSDGTPGRMQMFIFNGPNPDRSSGLDQEILIHELTHGTSNRLHNNANGLNATQSGGMGEGWSDFYARSLLSTADEDVNGIYGAGGYSTLDITAPTAYGSNYYYGIRRFPYAVKTTVGGPNNKPHNPLTFADIDAGKINLTDGAFSRGPIGSSSAHAVHNIGEVWCMALLEVRARLINRMGFAAGNQRMLQLVTDGMKLDPSNPTLLDGRNSILAASTASGGGAAEEADIWAGFAARGMGFGATVTPAATTPITVTESFNTPNLLLGTVSIAAEDCQDANGAADPGETVQLAVQLTNPLGTPATGVTATITNPGGGPAVGYGTIGANGNATQNISYTVPNSASCGGTISLTIEINSSLGPTTKTYTLQVGLPVGLGAPKETSTGDVAIPLPDVATTEVPINVTDSGAVGDVNVRIRLNHTFDGDLIMSLVAPDGTAVPLSNNRGGSGDNFGSGANNCSGTFTVFDDSATTAISSGVAPFAGTFKPDSLLSALNGKQMNGMWKLRITDTGTADVGTLGCVQLQITEQRFYCCGVPGTPDIDPAPPATVVAESASPANNAPDPDETVTMNFPLKNVGTGLTTNLVATLLPGGGVNAPSGSQSYGVISPAGTGVAKPFTFVPSGNCGDNITATFQLQDGATNLGTVSFTIRLGGTSVGGASGSNAGNIAIPATGTGASTGSPANPYPSAINISGVTGTVTKVTAKVTGLSHTFPGDIDMLLLGPGGQTVMLMSDVGSSTDAVNATLTFDDTASSIGSTVVSGTFRPTNSGNTDAFPAPAPTAPYGSALSVFNGVSPNGQWRLFVVDDAGSDVGSIAGGWSLTITTADPLCSVSPCTLQVPANITQNNDPGQAGAIVNYPPTTVIGSCGVLSFAPPSGSFFSIGTTPVNVTGTRQDNSTTTASFNVTVVDAEPPVITGESVNPSVLWSPNHQMVNATVSYNVADNNGASGITRTLTVTSNEPVSGTGQGDRSPDWVVVNSNLVQLRSERAGGGNGRIYTITITAKDAANNSSSKTVTVSVPHDQR